MGDKTEMEKLEPMLNNIAASRTKQEWCLLSISNYEDFNRASNQLMEVQDQFRELKKDYVKQQEELKKIATLLDDCGVENVFFSTKYKLSARVKIGLDRFFTEQK